MTDENKKKRLSVGENAESMMKYVGKVMLNLQKEREKGSLTVKTVYFCHNIDQL